LAIGTIVWVGVRGRRWGLALWGGFLLILPLLGIGVMWFVMTSVRPGPGNLGVVSTAQLIQTRLPQQVDEPWVWQELDARRQAGKLTPQQVDSTVQALIAHMKATQPAGWNRPLSWQREFLTAAIQAGAVSEPVLLALCDAFFGPSPTVQPLERMREGKTGMNVNVNYGNPWANNSGLGMELLWKVERLLVDGKPVEVEQHHNFGDNWSGRLRQGLDAGDHELTVEVACAYVDEGKLIGLDANRLERKQWPKPRKEWTKTVSMPFKVYTQAEPIVALDTDPSLDPVRSGGVQVERLVVQAGPNGSKSVILKLRFPSALPIPVSADVGVKIGEQSLNLGRTWIDQQEGSHRSGGSQLQAKLTALDPAEESADVVLTPNPAHIEHVPDVERIWGRPITLRNVPLERLDLEAGQPGGGQ
jgi:hypothetical protein